MNYGIIAATIPCLHPFMKATTTNFGAAAHNQSPNASNAPKSHEHYGLSSVTLNFRFQIFRAENPEKRAVSVSEDPVDVQKVYTTEGFGNGATVAQYEWNVRLDQQSLESLGSEQAVIKRRWM